jgi:glutamyl-tRNA synthetase
LSASTKPIVTRFAPSPTGFLHIGGARTALFNWLFARHHGGKFLLRIEDTDKVRSTKEAIAAILDGMNWLGLDWDGHEYYQSQFWARHAEVAHRLLERGAAYRCYMTQEELAAQREKAQAERKPFRISSPWRDVTDEQGDKPFVIRLKSPREGETVIEDKVQGRVTVQNAELDDFILLRSDGNPWRRSPQQRLPPAGNHSSDGLARTGLRSCAADPRAGRRKAVQAAWGAGRRRLS